MMQYHVAEPHSFGSKVNVVFRAPSLPAGRINRLTPSAGTVKVWHSCVVFVTVIWTGRPGASATFGSTTRSPGRIVRFTFCTCSLAVGVARGAGAAASDRARLDPTAARIFSIV